jgi:hypothetical protein
MNLSEALKTLKDRPDWELVLSHLNQERESALMDFQHSDLTDNPTKLARLAGEIAALDRIIRTFDG